MQGDADGEFTAQAGRPDTITDPAVYDPFESTDEEREVVEEYLDVTRRG